MQFIENMTIHGIYSILYNAIYWSVNRMVAITITKLYNKLSLQISQRILNHAYNEHTIYMG